LEAYIKTNFATIFNTKLNRNIGCGSITDGMYKIEAHVTNFSDEEYSTLKINKGDKIEIKGTMQISGNVVLIKPSSHQVKTILNQYVINKFNCHTNYKTRYNNILKNVIDLASISCDV